MTLSSRRSALAVCAAFLALLVAGCAADPVASVPPQSTPSERKEPTPTPRVTVAPTESPAPTPPPLPNDVPIEAGEYTYRGIPSLRITFTVAADGWESWGDGVSKGGTEPTRMSGFGFGEITSLYDDPCRWQQGRIDPPLGPTVDDLARGLAGLQRFDVIAPPADITAYGFDGKYVELKVSDDIVIADCDGGAFNSYIWTDGWARYHQGPNQIEQFWILDVEGTRLLINAASFAETEARHLAERDAIMDTIRIEAAD